MMKLIAWSTVQSVGVIFSTGTILYGAKAPYTAQIDSLDDALSTLRRMRAAGAWSVKSYNQPRREQRQQVALGLLAYELAGADAGAVLGTALAIKMLAYAGVAPVAQAFADRLPRRSLLVALDLVRAAVALCLPFVTEVWQVYVLVGVLQAASAAGNPEISPAHLLVALLDQTDGIAAPLLKAVGVDPVTVRNRAQEIVGHGALTPPAPGAQRRAGRARRRARRCPTPTAGGRRPGRTCVWPRCRPWRWTGGSRHPSQGRCAARAPGRGRAH